MALKTISATIYETIILKKEVTVCVDEDINDVDLEQEIRNVAYDNTIFDGDHGWEGIDTLEVEINIHD